MYTNTHGTRQSSAAVHDAQATDTPEAPAAVGSSGSGSGVVHRMDSDVSMDLETMKAMVLTYVDKVFPPVYDANRYSDMTRFATAVLCLLAYLLTFYLLTNFLLTNSLLTYLFLVLVL